MTRPLLNDKFPAIERDYGLVLAREDIDDIRHNPEWVERNKAPDANLAEKKVRGLPLQVVWRDTEGYHLVITVFISKEPLI